MSKADIAELLAVAYALHRANCASEDRDPVKYGYFLKYYKDHIQDFRQGVGAADPITG